MKWNATLVPWYSTLMHFVRYCFEMVKWVKMLFDHVTCLTNILLRMQKSVS